MEADFRQRFLTRFFYIAAVVGLGYLFFRYLLPLLLPFVFGFLLAMLLHSQTIRFADRTRLPFSVASACVLLLVYLFAGLLLAIIVTQFYAALTSVAQQLPTYLEHNILPIIQQLINRLQTWQVHLPPTVYDLLAHAAEQLPSVFSAASAALAEIAADFLRTIPSFVLDLLLTVVSSFFFAADYRSIVNFLLRQLPPRGKKMLCVAKHFTVGTLFRMTRSYGIMLLLTFAELVLGFLLLKTPHPFAAAAVIALVDLLPILGVGLILIPWAVALLLQQAYTTGIGLLVLFGAVEISRNMLEPRIVGRQTGLHPVISFVCMIVGLRLFGLIGLFALPVLATVLKKLNDEELIHLFR